MRLFDPLGILSPLTIHGRILLQDAWRSQVDWDSPLPSDNFNLWLVWYKLLSEIQNFKLPRWHLRHAFVPVGQELHVFADASESAYACVAYWRFFDVQGNIHISFIAGKARVTPNKPVSIPRLELQAALLAVRLAVTIVHEHNLEPSRRVFWTDSRNVLGWLRVEGRCLKTFVANRVGEISKETSQRNIYMDDFVGSVSSIDQAQRLVQDIVELHKLAQFEMRGWVSNCPAALNLISPDLLADPPSEVPVTSPPVTNIRTLGLFWNVTDDMLSFRPDFPEEVPSVLTKRIALSHVMRLFDPLGILSPLTIHGRILLQDAWRSQVDWDSPLPSDNFNLWLVWYKLLSEIQNFKLPRWHLRHAFVPVGQELHVFADASESAYACVAYWRFFDVQGNIHISFIAGKARVTPNKPVSIPRLELQAALLAVRLAVTIVHEHNLEPSRRVFWTDSRNVLGWLRVEGRCLKTFVANRVGEISKETQLEEWRWVPSELNPADAATRVGAGVPLVWLYGPSFLYLTPDMWPSETSSNLNEECLQEFKSSANILAINVSSPARTLSAPIAADSKRFSSWLRMIRVTARAHQYVHILCQRRLHSSFSAHLPSSSRICQSLTSHPHSSRLSNLSPLGTEDISKAEIHALRKSQLESFPDEIEALRTRSPIERRSRLFKLSPYLDNEGVIRLRGRIEAADVPFSTRRPIVLDGRDPTVRLLLSHYHKKLGHANTHTVINEIRQRYWVHCGLTLCILALSYNLTVALAAVAQSLDVLQHVHLNNHQNKTNFTNTGENELFHWEDYTVLAAMLIVSCGIGVFYGYFGEKQTTGDDFLLGGSSMGTFPMALSLAASFITAIELLGNPAEMYMAGAQFWMICVAFVLVVPITSQLFLPVFMRLRLTSCYEYLEVRFCKTVRVYASGLYMMQMILYTAVAVYAPALALSDVTGLNTYLAVSLIYVVCIFYASQGGMKAVIMTDTFQSIVLLGSLIVILLLGAAEIGGFNIMWKYARDSDRLHFFDMDPDPTVRHSFWSVVVGGTVYWTSMFCANQASVQKYLSVERLAQARVALWVSAIGLIAVYSINFITGAILATHYKDCDPIKAAVISASDRLLPLYVVRELGSARGVPGFFVAGIFAASLGTVASALNSLAAIACQDLSSGFFGITFPENKGAMIAKWVCLGCGALSFGLVFLVERLGPVLQLALSFNGIAGGVSLGLFSLGMLFPWSNSRGATIGGVFGLVVVLVAGGGAQLSQVPLLRLPASTSGCETTDLYNGTSHVVVQAANKDGESVFWLFRVSYLWYSSVGWAATILMGLLVSAVSGVNDPSAVPIDLISPPVVTLLNALPCKIKKALRVPTRLGTERRRSSSVRPPSVADDKDSRRRRRLSEMAGGTFYSDALGHDNYAMGFESEKHPPSTPPQSVLTKF